MLYLACPSAYAASLSLTLVMMGNFLSGFLSTGSLWVPGTTTSSTLNQAHDT